MTRAQLDTRDTTERLGADDMATVHTEQLLEAARLGHQRAAAKASASTPGVCSNCGEVCLPAAVYCDPECRADHERRLRVRRRQGAAR